ncbi:hypothetical protein TNCV_2523791 [Trichonephila clavipes]|nr:hypothetical protein TNCV_2523791 [Trichonephila clavipes]
MGGRGGDLGYLKALWKSGKICSPYFTYPTDAGSPMRVFEIGITQECGCVGFNGPDGRQGCALTQTVESKQGGRFDSNESASDSFPSGAVGFKSWSARILEAFFPLTSARKNL